MRKNAGSWIIKFILGAVILAFIPFGYGIYQDRRDVKIATVNGDPVRFEEFNRQYNNLVEQVPPQFWRFSERRDDQGPAAERAGLEPVD